ncbi:MAG: ABC transporter substrate-binding protein [Alphaproteobacteria bacterium]|nr:ABC transporter substrate-binding protein [Alphaproteobacteria bacterium]
MKKLLIVFACIVSFAIPLSAAETADAEKFAQDLANNIVTNVVQPQMSLSRKQDIFRKIFMAAINVKTNARFTLGRYAKSAAPDQLQAYTDALADNIIYTWTDRFNSYAGDSLDKNAISFESARKSENGDFYITSKIKLPNAENDIELIWRISDKKGELKLADLVVEGVSMLMSYRNEYTAILQQNGGDITALTEMLKQKNDLLKNPVKK